MLTAIVSLIRKVYESIAFRIKSNVTEVNLEENHLLYISFCLLEQCIFQEL